MSIQETVKKIKRGARLPRIRSKITLFSVFFGMCVWGVLCFMLGYLFFAKSVKPPEIQFYYPPLVKPVMAPRGQVVTGDKEKPLALSKEQSFVAAKKGTVYYPVECTGSNRIKEENRVYFKTLQEAESAGYTRSKTCK